MVAIVWRLTVEATRGAKLKSKSESKNDGCRRLVGGYGGGGYNLNCIDSFVTHLSLLLLKGGGLLAWNSFASRRSCLGVYREFSRAQSLGGMKKSPRIYADFFLFP